MKRTEIKKKGDKTVTIETKWLRIEEAAAYSSVSRTTFNTQRSRIPHGMFNDVLLYDCQVLDKFINNELPEEVCETEAAGGDVLRRRRGTGPCGSPEGLRNPLTGKVYKVGTDKKRRGSALRGESLPRGEKQSTVTASPL